jgi:NAD(P)H-dependent FMN reductase
MKIEIISGSPRKNSITRRLALHLQKQLREHYEHEINIIDMYENDFPALEGVFSSIEKTPEAYRPLAERMFAAEAFILVTPEYNGSYTSAMKNLLDHFPKQHHKPFGIVTASPGALGGMRAAMQLQQLVFALFGIGSPYMLVTPQVDKKFDAEGNLLDENFRKSVDQFLTEFLWLAERIAVSSLKYQV